MQDIYIYPIKPRILLLCDGPMQSSSDIINTKKILKNSNTLGFGEKGMFV